MKHYEKIISALIVLMIVLCPFSALAYDVAEDVEIILLNIRDENGKEITAIENPNLDVTVFAGVKGWRYADEDADKFTLLVGIFDKTTDKMKTIKGSATLAFKQWRTEGLGVTFDKQTLIDAGVTAGDEIRLFFWDEASGMQQLRSSFSSKDSADIPKSYSTNNVTDYNDTFNGEVRGDNWSYLTHYDYNLNLSAPIWDSAKNSAPHGLAEKGGDNWYSDPNGQGHSWYLSPDGTVLGQTSGFGGRPIIYAYTIGTITAGKDLTITGTLTAATVDSAQTDMYVFKTRAAEDTVVYGDGRQAVRFPQSMPANNPNILRGSYKGDHGSFEIKIPAAEARRGNDILFWFEFRTVSENKLNVTITATDPE